MIIPVRCFTCNKVIGHMWNDYCNMVQEEKNKEFQKTKFNSIELPLYVILTPDEKLVGTKAFTRDLQEFLDFLEKGVNS